MISLTISRSDALIAVNSFFMSLHLPEQGSPDALLFLSFFLFQPLCVLVKLEIGVTVPGCLYFHLFQDINRGFYHSRTNIRKKTFLSSTEYPFFGGYVTAKQIPTHIAQAECE